MRSRRNALRHGLSAETVIEIVEDIEDYRGFEAAIIADYDAQASARLALPPCASSVRQGPLAAIGPEVTL
jgi:hypothetical protein